MNFAKTLIAAALLAGATSVASAQTATLTVFQAEYTLEYRGQDIRRGINLKEAVRVATALNLDYTKPRVIQGEQLEVHKIIGEDWSSSLWTDKELALRVESTLREKLYLPPRRD